MGRISTLISAIILATTVAAAPSFGAAPSAEVTTDEVTWSVRPADGEFGVNRPNLLVVAAPGGRQRDAITIANYSDRDLELDVYATTADIGADGAPLAGERDEEGSPSDPHSWVDFAEDSVTVGAGEAVTVPFTVTVPFNAEPGDHAVAILTSWLSDEEIAVDRRLGIRGYFRIGGGQAPSATVDDIRVEAENPADPTAARGVWVTFTLRNSGNMRVASTADIVLRDVLGRDLGGELSAHDDDARFTLTTSALPDLGPGESVEVRAFLRDVSAPFAIIAADVRVTSTVFADGEALHPLEASGWTFSVAWSVLIALVLVAGAAVLIPVARRRARIRFDERVAAAVRDREAEPATAQS